MKTYKNASNTVFAFEINGSQDYLITPDLVAISEADANVIRNPPLSTDQMWNAIKNERDRRSENGGYKVGTSWFHSDSKSKIQQLGLVMAGAGLPAGLQWKTMGGSFVTMTPSLAGQIFQTAMGNSAAIFGMAETHKANMLASPTPSTYNYLTGWPLAFGE